MIGGVCVYWSSQPVTGVGRSWGIGDVCCSRGIRAIGGRAAGIRGNGRHAPTLDSSSSVWPLFSSLPLYSLRVCACAYRRVGMCWCAWVTVAAYRRVGTCEGPCPWENIGIRWGYLLGKYNWVGWAVRLWSLYSIGCICGPLCLVCRVILFWSVLLCVLYVWFVTFFSLSYECCDLLWPYATVLLLWG